MTGTRAAAEVDPGEKDGLPAPHVFAAQAAGSASGCRPQPSHVPALPPSQQTGCQTWSPGAQCQPCRGVRSACQSCQPAGSEPSAGVERSRGTTAGKGAVVRLRQRQSRSKAAQHAARKHGKMQAGRLHADRPNRPNLQAWLLAGHKTARCMPLGHRPLTTPGKKGIWLDLMGCRSRASRGGREGGEMGSSNLVRGALGEGAAGRCLQRFTTGRWC